MLSAEQTENLKKKLKARALPLAFLLGFIASLIAVDPFSTSLRPDNRPIATHTIGEVDPFANPEISSDQSPGSVSEANQNSFLAADPQGANTGGAGTGISGPGGDGSMTESGAVASIGGIDGLSEAGSAHPFDRAVPRAESAFQGPNESIDPATGLSIGDGANSAVNSAKLRRPASLESWDSSVSLQKLNFDDNEPLWNGRAQVLPNPMFVSQLTERRMRAIRGGGWLAIDLTRGVVLPVELFKAQSSAYTSRAVIEAKVVQVDGYGGERILNTVNTGIPVVRGVEGVVVGPYEVPETPACLIKYSVVTKEEICQTPRPRSAGGSKIRFRFEPHVPATANAQGAAPLEDHDFQFTTVYVESQPDKWTLIGTFNESFTPIGDPNRDGYPDFYLENLSDGNESGQHDLLLSSPLGNGVSYKTYSAKFIGK